MAEVSLKVFCSYCHKDESLRDQLANHLSAFRHQGVISIWHDRNISAGQEWDDEIKENLKTADIILLLISSDFIASKYCWSVEVKTAIERHDAGEACVIPVILRSVYWKSTPLARLQSLPKNAEPVKSWSDPDAAFTNVAEGFWNAAEKLIEVRKQKLKQQEEAEKLQRLREQEETQKLQLQQQAEEANRQLKEAHRVERLPEQIEVERWRQEEAERLQQLQKQEEVERLRQEQQSAGNNLPSEKGVDYTRLRDLLEAGKWKEADQETLAVMLKASGREQEGWLNFESIEKFPCSDLRTIDQLWVKYSNGRFGFSVQKRIWESVGGTLHTDYETWCKFGDRVGWRKWRTARVVNRVVKQSKQEWLDYSDLTFDTSASEGHLPGIQVRESSRLPWRVWNWKECIESMFSDLFSRVETCKL
ncbi:MAG: GUN4 domain-containing protein [Nostoc sp. DcaGUA01]|nr:GUN4 domain-containing protein [Nostoc sp. DcaGUA01]